MSARLTAGLMVALALAGVAAGATRPISDKSASARICTGFPAHVQQVMNSPSGPTSWQLTRLPVQQGVGVRAACEFSLQYPDGSVWTLSLFVYRDGTEPDHGTRKIRPNLFHVYVIPGLCTSGGVVGTVGNCSRAVLGEYRVQFSGAGIVSTASAGQTAAPDPCKLVTAADAEAVLRTAVLPCQRVLNSEFRVGVYQSQGPPPGIRHVNVETRRVSKAGFLKFEKTLLLARTAMTINGLGASAVYDEAVLVVWRHGSEARFFVAGLANPLAADIALAKRALTRM